MKYLFVYGTLKKGFCNHDLLEEKKFVGDARTLKPYKMYPASYYEFPYLISQGGDLQVNGELYEVEESYLEEVLDEFEGVGAGLYKREPITVTDTDANRIEALTYIAGEDISDEYYIRETPLGTWLLAHEKLSALLLKTRMA